MQGASYDRCTIQTLEEWRVYAKCGAMARRELWAKLVKVLKCLN